jgi:hypothetical protein
MFRVHSFRWRKHGCGNPCEAHQPHYYRARHGKRNATGTGVLLECRLLDPPTLRAGYGSVKRGTEAAAKVERRFHSYLHTLVGAGVRPWEGLALQWDDLDSRPASCGLSARSSRVGAS